jgi:hypothetical protein
MFLWGFPVGTFLATWFYWPVVQAAGFAFPFYLLSVPFIFAMVVIRTTTGRLRLWSWQMPMLHLAFLWSTYSTLGILILGDTIAQPLSTVGVIKSAVFCAFLGGGIGTLVDIVGIDEGLLDLHHLSMERGTVKTVLSYSFKFFGIFGGIFGVIGKAGHFVLVELGATRWLPVLILGMSLLLCLPFMVHFLLPRKERLPAREPKPSLNAQ